MNRSRPLFDRIPQTKAECARRASASITQWNALYPVGTAVRVYRLFGCEETAFNTTTLHPSHAAFQLDAQLAAVLSDELERSAA